MPTVPVKYQRRDEQPGQPKLIRKADGSLVEAHRNLTPDEVKARDERVIRSFLESRERLLERGVLP